jgi:recombinational DNA repair ATPase RecF
MTTTTPAEIHETIVRALVSRASECRKLAAGHSMAGPHNADIRSVLRAEAQRCDDLRRILGHVTPEALASVMEA